MEAGDGADDEPKTDDVDDTPKADDSDDEDDGDDRVDVDEADDAADPDVPSEKFSIMLLLLPSSLFYYLPMNIESTANISAIS